MAEELARVTLLRFFPPRNCRFGDMDEIVAAIRDESGCWVDWHVAGARGEFAAICCQPPNTMRVGMALLKVISDVSMARINGQERADYGQAFEVDFARDPEIVPLGDQESRSL